MLKGDGVSVQIFELPTHGLCLNSSFSGTHSDPVWKHAVSFCSVDKYSQSWRRSFHDENALDMLASSTLRLQSSWEAIQGGFCSSGN